MGVVMLFDALCTLAGAMRMVHGQERTPAALHVYKRLFGRH